MKFGAFLWQRRGEDLAANARLAEQLGFESVKHALIRDAAYEALLKSRRKELHHNIATLLTRESPQRIDAPPELIAHHCTEAGLAEQAVRFWRRAGKSAIERSANVEAVRHLRKALELAQSLPATPERSLRQANLWVMLTNPLTASQGYSAPEVEQATSSALRLCEELGNVPELFSVLGALNSICFNKGDLELAEVLAKRMLVLAKGQTESLMLLWAHYAMGFCVSVRGRLRESEIHLRKTISLYDSRRAGNYGFVQDPGPTALLQLSFVVHALGFRDQALKLASNAVDSARTLPILLP